VLPFTRAPVLLLEGLMHDVHAVAVDGRDRPRNLRVVDWCPVALVLTHWLPCRHFVTIKILEKKWYRNEKRDH
jgi:hypothetical protein